MRRIAGPLAIAVLVVGMFFGLKLRYGDFNHYNYVKVDIPRAGQLLRVGTDVREHGVVVGKVSQIELVNRQAQLTLYRHPEAVTVAQKRGADFSESDLPKTEEKPAQKHSPAAHWAAFTFSGVRPASGK